MTVKEKVRNMSLHKAAAEIRCIEALERLLQCMLAAWEAPVVDVAVDYHILYYF